MKYFVIFSFHIYLLHVIFILPWDRASSPVLEGEASPKCSVTQDLGRYNTPIISQTWERVVVLGRKCCCWTFWWCPWEPDSAKKTVAFLGTRTPCYLLGYSHYIPITSPPGWVPLWGSLPQPEQSSCPLPMHFVSFSKPGSQFIPSGGLTNELCVASLILMWLS